MPPKKAIPMPPKKATSGSPTKKTSCLKKGAYKSTYKYESKNRMFYQGLQNGVMVAWASKPTKNEEAFMVYDFNEMHTDSRILEELECFMIADCKGDSGSEAKPATQMLDGLGDSLFFSLEKITRMLHIAKRSFKNLSTISMATRNSPPTSTHICSN